MVLAAEVEDVVALDVVDLDGILPGETTMMISTLVSSGAGAVIAGGEVALMTMMIGAVWMAMVCTYTLALSYNHKHILTLKQLRGGLEDLAQVPIGLDQVGEV